MGPTVRLGEMGPQAALHHSTFEEVVQFFKVVLKTVIDWRYSRAICFGTRRVPWC